MLIDTPLSEVILRSACCNHSLFPDAVALKHLLEELEEEEVSEQQLLHLCPLSSARLRGQNKILAQVGADGKNTGYETEGVCTLDP